MSEMVERFTHAMREVAKKLQEAIEDEHVQEAELKRMIARKKIEAQAKGMKADTAQTTFADECDDIFHQRLALGTAKARVAALKLEAKRVEIGFEGWRSERASQRLERRAYGA